ncbi:phosphotransferase [Planosporangium flavigriseum]|uniref:Choline kinase n=1 Tax=Planosporangium flavigriseum TaxID=373681 RepID=A0A8J3LKX3_9ACTN|nr:phosphotransferase [Planosporangium flavigriseum]NJC66050.1 phosphotransferase [Planosporangium flavigriseum]GIG75083.1 choline kinase [Planosporangium flavigriseum]
MSSEAVTAEAPGAPALTDAIMDEIAVLRGRSRRVEELSGGLTNRNYKVTTDEGSYVVRVSSEETGALAINRDYEYRNSVIAAQAGVGAPVIAHLPDRHVMVVGFINGHTFADHDFAVPGNIERVAQACRTLHAGPAFVNDFNMFDIQRGYLTVVRENGYRLPDGYSDFEPQVAAIRRALAVRDEGTVPCNNDLLAANFVDDGDKIWLIDYEYSGNNDACFELGNIWSECHLDLDQLEALVTAYYGRFLRNKLARAQLQGLMSKYGWTLWASIQQATSPIDFDFWGWGMEKYESATAIFRSARFDQLLEEVQRAA